MSLSRPRSEYYLATSLTILRDFRALDPRIFILAFARLVVTLGFAAVLPYLGVVLHQERGVSATVIGVIWTVAGLSGAVMQWVAGEITDRVGRRPVLLIAMTLRTVNLAALGYQIEHQGPILAIAGLCVLNSILRGFVDPVASAMVADLAPSTHRIAAFSLQRVGVNIGWALGSMSAGFAHGLHLSFGQLFYASSGITLLATWAASTIAETHQARKTAAGEARQPFRLADIGRYWSDRRFMGFLLASLLFFLLQAQLYAPLSLYASSHLHLSLIGVSHLYATNGWMVVALQVPAFFYIRRVGPERVLIVGAFAYATSYALCGLATQEGNLLVCVAFITLAEIISAPAQQTAMVSMAPVNCIGAYAGLFGLTQSVGQSLGPLIGTSLLDALPDRLTWPILALFGIGAALLFRRVLHMPRPEPSTAVPAA